MTLAEIRAAYPHPVKASPYATYLEAYCVGGAYLQSLGSAWKFPGVSELRIALKAPPNSLLPKMILSANDRADFEEAWRLLGIAMEHKVLDELQNDSSL